jgi:hypothetical protein
VRAGHRPHLQHAAVHGVGGPRHVGGLR